MDTKRNFEARSITLTMPTGQKKRDGYGDMIEAAVTLTVSHDPGSKRYVVWLDREARGPVFVRRVIDFGTDAPDIVGAFRYSIHAARYSKKTLEQIFDNVITDWNDTMLSQAEAEEWANKILDRD